MKKTALAAVAMIAALALGFTRTHEVLVLNSAPTLIARTQWSSGFEICNNGPNTIDCALGREDSDGGSPMYTDGGLALRLTKARAVATGACWSAQMPWDTQLWCQARTADQVTGAATVLTEAP